MITLRFECPEPTMAICGCVAPLPTALPIVLNAEEAAFSAPEAGLGIKPARPAILPIVDIGLLTTLSFMMLPAGLIALW